MLTNCTKFGIHKLMRRHVRHKFSAKQTVTDGIKFQSILEAEYYSQLRTLQSSGIVLFFLRQTPFHLPGSVKYVVDFQVFYHDGHVEFVDVKGFETAQFKLKLKLVEATYPIKITIVKKNDFRIRSNK